MSVSKYKSAQATTENGRQTEYRLFADVTKSLMSNQDKKQVDPECIKAIDWNRRLWITLQSDLAAEDNGFPDELKAQLISLAIWVDKHSQKAMRGEARLAPLISVNRSIMEGLANAHSPNAPTPSAPVLAPRA